jgi:hypothetical protein
VQAIGRDGAVLVRRKLLRAEVIGFFADIFFCNENSVVLLIELIYFGNVGTIQQNVEFRLR